MKILASEIMCEFIYLASWSAVWQEKQVLKIQTNGTTYLYRIGKGLLLNVSIMNETFHNIDQAVNI